MEKRLRSQLLLYCLVAGMFTVMPSWKLLHAQVLEQTKISGNFQDESVSLRLKKIQEKAGLTIAFEEKDVQDKTAAAARFSNASLHKVLQQALKGLSLEYRDEWNSGGGTAGSYCSACDPERGYREWRDCRRREWGAHYRSYYQHRIAEQDQ